MAAIESNSTTSTTGSGTSDSMTMLPRYHLFSGNFGTKVKTIRGQWTRSSLAFQKQTRLDSEGAVIQPIKEEHINQSDYPGPKPKDGPIPNEKMLGPDSGMEDVYLNWIAHTPKVQPGGIRLPQHVNSYLRANELNSRLVDWTFQDYFSRRVDVVYNNDDVSGGDSSSSGVDGAKSSSKLLSQMADENLFATPFEGSIDGTIDESDGSILVVRKSDGSLDNKQFSNKVNNATGTLEVAKNATTPIVHDFDTVSRLLKARGVADFQDREKSKDLLQVHGRLTKLKKKKLPASPGTSAHHDPPEALFELTHFCRDMSKIAFFLDIEIFNSTMFSLSKDSMESIEEAANKSPVHPEDGGGVLLSLEDFAKKAQFESIEKWVRRMDDLSDPDVRSVHERWNNDPNLNLRIRPALEHYIFKKPYATQKKHYKYGTAPECPQVIL